jgi:hypothetical protein
MRLRDCLILCLINLFCVPIMLCLVVHLWAGHMNAEIMNSVRERQMEEEARRSLV